MGRTQGLQIHKGLGQVLLQDQGIFHGVLSVTSLTVGRPLHILGEGAAASLVRDAGCPRAFPLPTLRRRGPHPSGRIVVVETEAQREVGRCRRPEDAG